MDVKQFVALKARLEEKKHELSKAKGVQSEIDSTLKQEFNCGSIEEARQMLEEVKQEEAKFEEQLSQSVAEFEEKYGERL